MANSNVLSFPGARANPSQTEQQAKARSKRAVDLFVKQRQLGNLELMASCIDTIIDDAPISPGLIPYSLLEDLKRLQPRIEAALATAEHDDVTNGQDIA